ncbi:MAG: bifunctional DNA-formamidopyrimidine glycosylase/DNA-(apurinic or apyrimidinic site) lyase [Dehalococcoidia bacterium]|nr:bifunctional DNA-formamidopyrimidine glycosylase/DNA-(apurinic or apyrimidinic site) lyase [Dehalococcoidia bacterium]
MPELPEVETIRRELVPKLVGHQFMSAELLWPKVVREPAPEEFCRRVAGQRIEDIRRRGKYFIFHLSDRDRLVVHLKMTGALLILTESQQCRNHTTAIFTFDGGIRLHFIDQRKFGAIWLVEDENRVVGELGPEPLEPSFTPMLLHRIAERHRVPIKALLCDQHSIAGIGNMYADEALFVAGIHPLRAANSLSDSELSHLHGAVIEVLQKGIEKKGASMENYLRPDGGKGEAQSEFRVAHRRGEACLVCGSPITRISIRGRGTYFCPCCQGSIG